MTTREVSDFQKWSVLAYRALDDAGRVLMTVEPECNSEDDKLKELQATIRELLVQALVLNNVLTRRQLDREFEFSKLDTEALIAAQPASEPPQESAAIRYDFDGYGWKYIDSGSGSNWRERVTHSKPITPHWLVS